MLHRSRVFTAVGLIALAVVACSGTKPDSHPTMTPSTTATPSPAFRLSGRATAIETTGRVQGFTSLRLDGTFQLASTVTVSGRMQRLLVDGGPVTLRGDGLGVLGRASTITASGMEVVGDAIPPKASRRTADRPGAFPRVFLGAGVEIAGPHVLLDDHLAAGPNTITATAGSAVLYGTARAGLLPATFDVVQDDSGRAPRAAVATPTFFSWRGSGDVTLAGRRFVGKTLTLVAARLAAHVSRSGAAYDVTGEGQATQVAVEGRPQLRTVLTVKARPPANRLYRGTGEAMIWEQDDSGPWEAIVTEVRPINAAARWVRLYVDDPPPLDGPGGRPLARSEPRCGARSTIFAEDYLCAQLGPGKGIATPLIVNPPTLQPSGDFDAHFMVFGNFPTLIVTVRFVITPR